MGGCADPDKVRKGRGDWWGMCRLVYLDRRERRQRVRVNNAYTSQRAEEVVTNELWLWVNVSIDQLVWFRIGPLTSSSVVLYAHRD